MFRAFHLAETLSQVLKAVGDGEVNRGSKGLEVLTAAVDLRLIGRCYSSTSISVSASISASSSAWSSCTATRTGS